MKKNNISKTLLYNITAAFGVFALIFFINVIYVSSTILRLDSMLVYLHDYADIAQLCMNQSINEKDEIVLKKFLLEQKNHIDKASSERDGVFKEFMNPEEYQFYKKSLSVFTYTYEKIENNKGALTKELTLEFYDKLEESYINFLTLNNIYVKKREIKVLKVFGISSVGAFICFASSLIFIRRKIISIVDPISGIATTAEEYSLGNTDKTWEANYSFDEYNTLVKALSEMDRRIRYQNRVKNQASAASFLSDYTENLAHAINNPLAIIATTSKTLEKSAKKRDDEKSVQDIKEIRDSVSRITDITVKMKNLILPKDIGETAIFKYGNITTTINLLFFNKLFEKKIRFYSRGHADDIIYAKEAVVTQIVVSTIDNAIQHCNEEGGVIELIKEKTEKGIEIKIRDNGEAPDEIEITRYFLGENTMEGLGLFSSRRIALENGYDFEYSSKPFKEFTLSIPLKQETNND